MPLPFLLPSSSLVLEIGILENFLLPSSSSLLYLIYLLFALVHKRLERFILVTVMYRFWFKIKIALIIFKLTGFIYFFLSILFLFAVFKLILNVVGSIFWKIYTNSPFQCTCRLESTLNYGLERVWAIGYLKSSHR